MSRFMPRKRTILGGTLLVGAAIGIWFGNLWPKLGSSFGLGSGGDRVIGTPDMSKVAVQSGNSHNETSNEEIQPQEPMSSDASGRKLTHGEEAPPDDVLTILVEERHYAVWRKTRKGNGYFPTPLEEILPLALNAETNQDGIRVQIIRSATARVIARQKLHAELVKAGIPPDEIVIDPELRRAP